jgi:Cdc6-like AAA superfamily ATPase
MKIILKFLLQPLLNIKKYFTRGEKYFDYLYFTRNGIEKKILCAINENQNITLVGKPGNGKSSLIHYIFLKLKQDDKIYAIILDYHDISPRKKEALLMKFIYEMLEFFKKIKKPLTILTERTTLENAENHLYFVADHLQKISNQELPLKLVILLDDLDFAETHYYSILKDYFLSFTINDKSIIILSVRQQLLNTILRDDILQMNYYRNPQYIELTTGDLELILANRLKPIIKLNEKDRELIDKFLAIFKNNELDLQLKEEFLEKHKDSKLFTTLSKLPFNQSFYANFDDIIHSNLRFAEELFPDFLEYELNKNENEPSFNNNFYDAFITNTFNKRHILLDLVSEKTTGPELKKRGNSILQNVLEGFCITDALDDNFYKNMDNLGIDRVTVNKSIVILENYCLIEPIIIYKHSKNIYDENDKINTNKQEILYEIYKMTRKGEIFMRYLLTNPLYYSSLNGNFIKSKRSFYLEYNQKRNFEMK